MLTQLSMDWRLCRLGNMTASKAAAMLAPNQSKTKKAYYWAPQWLGKVAGRYLMELVAERMTDVPADRVTSYQMRYGQEHEEESRERAKHELWRLHGESLLLPVGDLAYVSHPDYPDIGCSPDFGVAEDTLGELKNPVDGSRHVEAIFTRDWLELEHRPQIQFSLWVTGRQKYKLVSYDHRWCCQQLLIVDVERDTMYIESELEPGILRFRTLLLEMMDKHFPHVGQEAPF